MYSASYSYTPDEGTGCEIYVVIEWDGISAGGGFVLLGGTGCKDTQKGLIVPYPPYGSVGKHHVCAIVDEVRKPVGAKLPNLWLRRASQSRSSSWPFC